MIINKEALSMAESMGFVEEKEKPEIVAFVKRFTDLEADDAGEMKNQLQALKLVKLNQEYISKIIDILPEDSGDLNKVFVDTSLDEDETKKILDVVKKHK